MQIHLWELPNDLRVTFRPQAARILRTKLSENGWYRQPGQPWTNIARIYHHLGIDRSDRGRTGYNKFGRMWSLSIADFKELSRKTKVPLTDLEKDVVNLFRSTGTKGNVGPFPIMITEEYGWLAGLWFGCGGFYSREKEVRFRVEGEVAEEVERKARTIGCNFTVSHYMQHKARFPRTMVILPSSMYHIFKSLGFPHDVKGKHSSLKLGRNPATRERYLMLPKFVRENPSFGRAFVEGYMNSTKLAVWRYTKQVQLFGRHAKADIRGVDVRFIGPTKQRILAFASYVINILEKAGFTGSWRQIPGRTGHNLQYGLIITKKPQIKALFRDFRIVKGSAQRVLEGL